MMALIISLILLILIIYPLTVRAMRNFTITVPHVIDRAEGQININLKFNHFYLIYYCLCMIYNLFGMNLLSKNLAMSISFSLKRAILEDKCTQ